MTLKTWSLFDWKARLAFGSAFLILLVAGVVSYRSIVVSSESDHLVRHTLETLEKLQDLSAGVQSIESSYRGFVLTGDESYLDAYRAGIASAKQAEDTVRRLTAENPEQQRRLAAIARLTVEKIGFGEQAISLRRTAGLDAAADAIRSGPGERMMQELRREVRELEHEELRLLVLQNADAKRRLDEANGILILGNLVGLLIAAAAGWSVHRGSRTHLLVARALREKEEEYRMLLDGVQDQAIFMMDPRGTIVSWNAGAERITGYRADEIIGRNFSCFFPSADIERAWPEEVLRLTASSGRYEEQGMRVRKDGSRFLANVTFTALRDRAGNLRGFSEFSHDLSESKESGAKYRGHCWKQRRMRWSWSTPAERSSCLTFRRSNSSATAATSSSARR